MSFRRYMARRPVRPASPTGAFVQDYRNDLDAPDAQTLAELLDYLRQCGATNEVLHAARTCWNTYQRSRYCVTTTRL